MNTAVIEFDPLTNPVGSSAQDHHFLSIARLDLVISAVVGGVVVRRISLKFGGAGVYQPITWNQPQAFAFRADFILRPPSQMGNLRVGKPERFGPGELCCVHRKFNDGQSKPQKVSAVQNSS